MSRKPQGSKLFEIALVSDMHVNEREDFSKSPYPANAEANPRARHVFHHIAKSEAAFVVHMGNMINPVPELSSYAEAADNFKDIASVLNVRLHLTPGSHDIGDKPVAGCPPGWSMRATSRSMKSILASITIASTMQTCISSC